LLQREEDMNESNYIEIIKEQTQRSLWSIGNVIAGISDKYWDKVYCEMPLWKHVYHTLHSLDRWYINPQRYCEPAFHEKDLNNLDVLTTKVLSHEELTNYFHAVKEKIEVYNESLIEDELLQKPDGCKWSRFTLITAQLRHLHYHTGIIMGFIIAETGMWPQVIGLEQDIPEGEDFPYFE
jgi:hypothetical protein